jgi:hypothetical protein
MPGACCGGQLTQPPLHLFRLFEKLQRLAVAAAGKIVFQAGVDWLWQVRLQLIDPVRNLPQPFDVFVAVAPAFFVSHDGQALAQRGGQLRRSVVHRVRCKPWL